ncbi:MAG: hypothetical protein JSV95_00620 [Gemmatimonadota bacterium]|jgi:hypothetical protein|nr:MAG: hypothetical protein JSV95_00620 [Gemmatimonadota bacterium]
MRLDAKGLGLACGILWGAALLLVSLGGMMWPGYGTAFLEFAQSIYPGYHGPGGIGPAIVVTLYGLVDGFIGGVVLAWLYNRFARGPAPA